MFTKIILGLQGQVWAKCFTLILFWSPPLYTALKWMALLKPFKKDFKSAGGTPSGDRVKSSDKKKQVGNVIYPWKAEILVISTQELF